MNNNNSNFKSIGGLWKKTSKNGASYLSGNVEIDGKKIRISVFPNKYKKKETSPDYTINLSNTPNGNSQNNSNNNDGIIF